MKIVFITANSTIRQFVAGLPDKSGGFADRLKGLLFASEWAESLGLKLHVYWQEPVTFDQIFARASDHIVSVSIEELKEIWSQTGAHRVLINILDLGTDEINQILTDTMAKKPDVCFLLANQFHSNSSPSTRAQLLHQTFSRHLRFSDEIENRARELCPLIASPGSGRIIGMQIRIGKHVGAKWDDPFLDSRLNWRLLRSVSSRYASECESYVFMSDAAQMTFGPFRKGNLKSLKPLWQSNNVHYELTQKPESDQLLDTIAQFFVLTVCSYVIHGKGEFGYLAAALGGNIAIDYHAALSTRQKRAYKWNHRFSRWRISIDKRMKKWL